MTDIFGDGSTSSSGWAQQFNRLTTPNEKLSLLNSILSEYGLGSIPEYSFDCARAKRNEYLGGLDEGTYVGTILPTVTARPGTAQSACA